MANIRLAAIPMIQTAQALTEHARDVLRLHRQDVPRSFVGVTASLEAAIDALDEVVEQMERG